MDVYKERVQRQFFLLVFVGPVENTGCKQDVGMWPCMDFLDLQQLDSWPNGSSYQKLVGAVAQRTLNSKGRVH